MKLITELKRIESTSNSNQYRLDVYAYDLHENEDFDNARMELEAIPNMKYEYLMREGIEAQVTGSYEEVMYGMRELEEKGWTWYELAEEEAYKG